MTNIHFGLAMATGGKEWMLDDDEAKKMAAATEQLARFYKIRALDPKTQAWCMFMQCAGMIYGPRVYKTVTRKMDQRRQTASPVQNRPQAQQSAPVQPIVPPVFPTAPTTVHPAQQGAPPMEGVNGSNSAHAPARGPVPSEMSRGIIPGVGDIQFPPDHPMMKRVN